MPIIALLMLALASAVRSAAGGKERQACKRAMRFGWRPWPAVPA